MVKTKKRFYEVAIFKHATKEKGGGTTNVEEKQCLSLDDMYKRMLVTGQIAVARHVASNTKINRAAADVLLKSAHEAPLYVPDGKKQEIRNSIAILEKKLAARKANEERKKLIDSEVIKKLEEIKNEEGFAV
jgi:hypothetical protein